jgi:hypothetical protein
MNGGGGGKGGPVFNMYGNIMVPEGQTVAKALNDISFWMSVSEQQGWAGGMPGD